MDDEQRIEPYEGCFPGVAAAVQAFSRAWGPYSERSRRYPIHRLLEEVVDPALTDYFTQLPPQHLGRQLMGLEVYRLGLAHSTKSYGFREIDRSIGVGLSMYMGMAASVGEYDEEFVATTETVRELVFMCVAKFPRKLKARDHEHLNAMRVRKARDGLCELCGEETELGAYLGQDSEESRLDEHITLSARYCEEHRPRIGEAWNPAYLRTHRSRVRFEGEVRRLLRQAKSLMEPRAASGDEHIDRFYQALLSPRALWPDDKREIRNEARRLVDAGISDRKKKIVMMVAAGLNQSEVSRRIGISRQAVSAALAGIPGVYRFDRPADQRWFNHASRLPAPDDALSESLARNLGSGFSDALADPRVADLMLNGDGGLWAGYRGQGNRRIGAVDESRAMEAMEAMACSIGVVLSDRNRSFEGTLPLEGAPRISASGPPRTLKVQFVIRRRLAW